MSNILNKTPEIEVTVININAVKVNGKCVVRTGESDTWIRQAAVYTDAEIEALQTVINRLNQSRKQLK